MSRFLQSKNFWQDLKNQKEYLRTLAKELGVDDSHLNGWYAVKIADVERFTKRLDKVPSGGVSLLHQYGNSLIKTLQSVYPEHKWQVWRFSQVPIGFWRDVQNQRDFFDWLSSKENLCIQTLDDWYSIRAADVEQRGGKELLKLYGRSLIKALQKAYPEHHFLPWKFSQVPKGYWEDPSNASEYVKWLSRQLNITKKEDWNLVTNQQIASLRGSTFIQKYGGLNSFLSKFLPELSPFGEASSPLVPDSNSTLSKGQSFLLKVIKELFLKAKQGSHKSAQQTKSNFENFDIHVNYKHPDLVREKSNTRMELDIFIPSISLAFEFQGEQHFSWHFLAGSPEYQQKKDLEKKEACNKAGITLIPIPYDWWNKSSSHQTLATASSLWEFRQLEEKLAELICKHRPDLASIMPQGGTSNLNESSDSGLTSAPLQSDDAKRMNQELNWNNIENQKQFLLNLASELGLAVNAKQVDWTQLSGEQVIQNGGKELLRQYNGSLSKTLDVLFPQEKNSTVRRKQLERERKEPKYWKNPSNQKLFLEEVARELGFDNSNEDNWYEVKTRDIVQLGGKGLLSRHDGSLIKALQHVYPEKEWHVWKFHHAPKNFWEDDANVYAYLQWLSKCLGISHLDEWYSVSYEQIIELHGSFLFKKKGKTKLSNEVQGSIVSAVLFGLLSKFYPNHPWDIKKFEL